MAREAEAHDYRCCRIERGVLDRWLIVHHRYKQLAWTGARWDEHEGGMPTGDAQVCNFDTRQEAVEYAAGHGLALVE